MAAFDPSSAAPVGGQFDPDSAVPYSPQPRGPLAEIGTGLARGALVDLPTVAGQALKYAGADNVGGALTSFGQNMGQKNWLTMQPESHGPVTNALASGFEGVAPALAPAMAIGAGAASLGALPIEATVAGAAGMGALFGGQQGQDTYEKGVAKGLDPEKAAEAARWDAAQTFGTTAALGLVGGKFLGTMGSSVNKVIGKEGPDLATSVLNDLSGQSGVIKPFLKQLPASAAEAVGVGAAQAGLHAGIENAYGIDNTDPYDAMKASIPNMLGLTAAMSPLGLVGRALNVRAAKHSADLLSNGATTPEMREQLAGRYIEALAKVNPQAAEAFRGNAGLAIETGQNLPIDPKLLQPDTLQGPGPIAPIDNVPRTGFGQGDMFGAPIAAPWAPAEPGQGEMFGTPPEDTRVPPQPGQGDLFTPEGAVRSGGQNDLFPGQEDMFGAPEGSRWPEDRPVSPQGEMFGNPPVAPEGGDGSGGGTPAHRGQGDLFPVGPDTSQGKLTLWPSEGGYVPRLPAPPDLSGATMYVDSHGQVVQGRPGFTFPDGSATNDSTRMNSYLSGLPDNQRAAAWSQGLGLDLTPQVGPKRTAGQEVDQLHGQITDALTEAGKPLAQPMSKAEFGAQKELKGRALADAYKDYIRDPATQEALMREDADTYEKLLAERDAAPQPPLNPLAEQPAKPDEALNPQLGDEMQKWLRQKAVNDAFDAYEAQREAERDLIAKRGKGGAEADAAERGEIAGDPYAPKQADELAADAGDAKQTLGDAVTDGSKRSFDARVAKLDQLGTHQEQIDAAQAIVDNPKLSDGVRDLTRALVERWRAELPAKPEEAQAQPAAAPAAVPDAVPAAKAELPQAPAQAETLGKNIETPSPATSEPPPGTEAVTDSMPSNLNRTPKQRAGDLITRLQSVLADFHTRANNGEPIRDMKPEERQRYDDAIDYKRTLTDIYSGAMKSPGEDWWKTMSGYVDDAERPYQKLREFKAESPDVVDPALLAPAIQSHKLSDLLAHLAENGSQPWVQSLAQRLHDMGLSTSLWRGDPSNTARATFDPNTNKIEVNPGGESEHVLLHEAVHAALTNTLERAEAMTTPRTQADATIRQAYRDLDAVRQDALKRATADDHYGLTDVHEFAAELMTNPDFQDFLKRGQKSLWSRALDAVRRMFGMKVDDRDGLEKAMDAAKTLMDAAQQSRDFDRSPEGAARATDNTLHAFAKVADAVNMGRNAVSLGSLARDVFKRTLGIWTEDFIAHQMDTIPDMVKSGFNGAVNAYRAARDSRRVLAEHIGTTLGKYTSDVQRLIRATDDPRKWSQTMQRIGGSAAIGQFDYRKNFADNKAADSTIPNDMKSHIDDVHREFKQLEAQQPELAKALVAGEKQNRKMLIQQVATIASNMISAHTGVVPRLEAELARMPLTDENRARLEERIKLARLDATFAALHLRGLDIMGEDLKTAKNGLPDVHLDGASSALAARLSNMFSDARTTLAGAERASAIADARELKGPERDAALASARQLPGSSDLRNAIMELEKLYKPQVKNPYFSLGRAGDYFVNIAFKAGAKIDAQTAAKLNAALDGTNKILGNLDGQSHAFFRVDTLDQAQGLRSKLEAAGGDLIDTGASAHGKLADTDMQTAAGISPSLRQLTDAINGMVDIDKSLNSEQALAVKQVMTRQLLSMLPETSARSAKMQRRGVPGYDGDFAGNFARRATGAVQDLSNLYTSRAFSAAQTGMKNAIETMNRGAGTAFSGDNAVRAQMVADEFNLRHANGMKPVDNTHVNMLNAFGHTFYLSASPAFLIRTMAQPWHRGLPILGAKFGFVKAAKETGGATADAIKIVGNTIRAGYSDDKMRGVLNTGMRFDNLGLPKADEAFVQEMHDRGILKLGQAQQLQHAVTGASQRQQDLVRMSSMTAQYAEMTNRLTVGLAAFRLATKGGMDQRAATDWAAKATNNAMDNFDADNTARVIGKHGFMGKSTPLFTSFMNYSLQTMQQIVRSVHDGYFSNGALPGESAEAFAQRKMEARHEFGGLMATTAMISGVMGLPFANAFAAIYNTLTKDRDDPSDIRGDIRNFLSRNLGGLGDVIANGVGHLANVDTSTFGLQNLLPGSEFLASRQLMKDRLDTQAMNFLGPAINGIVDVGLGIDKFMDGYYVKGIESMLPAGLKPYYKAGELATNGYTDSRGNPIPMGEKQSDGTYKAGTWDTLLQGLGFRTADKAVRDEGAYEFSQNEERRQNRRQILGDQLYKARGDSAAMAAAMENVRDYNMKNPLEPMTDIAGTIRAKALEHAIGTGAGLGINLGKRQAIVARQQIGYAAMPEGQ